MQKIKLKILETKGITLVALVVTIIVLLILAGVTISTVFSDNGIITKAKYAAFATKIAMYRDTVSLYSLSQAMNNENGQTSDIYVTDAEQMKEILGGNMDDEEAGKYGIQDNELRYKDENVTDQEREWLTQLGVLAMGTLYLITFITNGTTYKTLWADKVKFPETDPTSTEGSFAGWYYDIDGTREAHEGDELTDNLSLYAKWEKSTIKFMIDSDTVYQEMKAGDVIDFPDVNPTSTKGNFAGWYYDAECTREAHEGEALPENMTLYAKWENFKIKFMSNGEVYSEISNDENKVILPADPTHPQGDIFTFTGWYRDENAKFNKVSNGTIVTKDTILYAGWNVIFYNIEMGEQYNIYIRGEKNLNLILKYNDKSNIIKYELINAIVMIEDGYNTDIKYNVSDGVSIDENGIIVIQGGEHIPFIVNGTITIKVTYNDGREDLIVINFDQEFPCFAEGTMITLADMSEKAIEDIEYSDKLLVWDFDNRCFATAKPLWIKKVQTWNEYNYIKFEDGTELKTVLDHRIFNYDSQKFTYTMNEEDTPIGTRVFKQDGTLTKIVERKVVKEEVNYYNIITDYHMNLFANGLLTSLRLNNLYKIENMKFIKDNRELISKEEFKGIPDKYYYGLRLAEQPKEINRGNDVKHTHTLKEYVDRLLILEK